MQKIDQTLHSGFFITATDTGIGKTFVSSLLIRTFMKIAPVTYFKPVQTGCVLNEKGELVAPDFEFVVQAGAKPIAGYSIHVPYRFKTACSPHLACRLDNQSISFAHINYCFKILKGDENRSRLVVVEGAGGIYTPLGNASFMIDLMASLKLPIILVVSPRLGTLNHTLLSLNALRSHKLSIAGVVMNHSDSAPSDFITADNSEFVRESVRSAPFIKVDFNAIPSPSIEAFCRELLR